MEYFPEKKFPINSKDYKLYEKVGGVNATVYRALCIPFNEIVVSRFWIWRGATITWYADSFATRDMTCSHSHIQAFAD